MSKYDTQNMLATLRNFSSMIKESLNIRPAVINSEFEDIVIAGMGGSGFVGDMLKCYLQANTNLRITVVKNYVLPKFVNEQTLVFIVSYSGNTEETIHVYKKAARQNCKIVIISSGGKLQSLAEINGREYIQVPKYVQPRLATPYLFIPLLRTLSLSNHVSNQETVLRNLVKAMESSVNKIEENGFKIAEKIGKRIPIIYASTELHAIAEKWKTDINENAKIHAFYNVFPEFNHNEICGYTNLNGDFYIILIKDQKDTKKINKRFDTFQKVTKNIPKQTISLTGTSVLNRYFSAILMGFFVSYKLALIHKTDPTPVHIIENFKADLQK